MLFDIRFVADWKHIGDYRHSQTDCSKPREYNKRVDYDYKSGDRVLIRKDGILCKAESIWKKQPWTITTVDTNGTIRIQCRTKLDRINIWRVTPFSEELLIQLGGENKNNIKRKKHNVNGYISESKEDDGIQLGCENVNSLSLFHPTKSKIRKLSNLHLEHGVNFKMAAAGSRPEDLFVGTRNC